MSGYDNPCVAGSGNSFDGDPIAELQEDYDMSDPERSKITLLSARARLDLFARMMKAGAPETESSGNRDPSQEWRRDMPLWKMEQITPYFEREGNHTKYNPLGTKLVKDCLTNSEIGIISFVEEGGIHNEEEITAPTIMAHTLVTAKCPAYRKENPDGNSYEKAAKTLYRIYWSNLSCWGKLHRVCYMWSLPAIAVSLFLILIENIVL